MIKSLNAYIKETARILEQKTAFEKKTSQKIGSYSSGNPSLVSKIEQIAKLLRSQTH